MSRATVIAVASDHCHALPAIFITAHTAMVGALITTCSDMTMSICTCVTSFVERVIRLAVEKAFISSREKLSTLLNISALSRFE